MRRREFLHTAAVGGSGLLVLGGVQGCASREQAVVTGSPSVPLPLDRGWRFVRADPEGAHRPNFDDLDWSTATLPHAARVEALVTGEPGSDTFQWQGICWYRRSIDVPNEASGRRVFLHFDGAMNVADVWWNGTHLGRHMGGWLPFGFDVSELARPGGANTLAVRLDNRDNPVTGPKPLADLDFNSYHGLYRSVRLVVKDPLHITDPVLVDRQASGGLFVTFPSVSSESSVVRVQVHVRNHDGTERGFVARMALVGPDGVVVAGTESDSARLAPGGEATLARELTVERPALWDLRNPTLHTVAVQLVNDDGSVADAADTRVGIRRIDISPDGFRLNGERLFLRGTNRHQEYPYVGYALSDAAQRRDAQKIKDAGFDYVRLSHYPHAPAFLDACDELGLVVMDCIPGWQYFDRESEEFAALQLDNCRQMIRRDRNHPCVILWEVSLNESWMTDSFVAASHAAAHEEYPGDQCFTCGWTDGYDVFIQARQHGGCTEVSGRPCVVSEYGDWEYYAQNAGLQQETWADLVPDEANSRQLRWHGEAALLQQATNFQEAHNDNLKTVAFADGLWVMFDYNRGYAPDIESSGCLDLFRLPKLSRSFFRSQRPPAEELRQAESGPMVFIASTWAPDSSTAVRVFSNCEVVALHLDGELLGRRGPDDDRLSTHLAFPPFTFPVGAFRPGTLEAVGHIAGQEVARHAVSTPGAVGGMDLWLDEDGVSFAADGKDMVFLHAVLQDASGTTVPDAWENVFIGVTGDLDVLGPNPFSSDAGIASALVVSEIAGPRGGVYALCLVREGDHVHALGGGVSVGQELEPYEIRVTTDGTAPGPDAVRYAAPLPTPGRVRATLFVDGRAVVEADTVTPRFRIAGSTAPDGPE